MYVFNGKIDFEKAMNESITFVFPIGLALKDPACVYWQWSDRWKENNTQYGTIHEVTKTDTQYSIYFMCSYFEFEADFTPDFKSMTVKMYADPETPSTTTVRRSLLYPSLVPTTKVYTGKSDYHEDVTNEMIILVVPDGIYEGAPIGLYFQLTVDTKENPRTHYSISSTVHTVEKTEGQIKASFLDSENHPFDVEIYYPEARYGKITRRGATTSQVFHLQQNDWRQARKKRALIVRADTGADNGIFLLRDMLMKDLDFSPEGIEMLYWDGQRAPTGKRFKSMLFTLLSGAQPGDVRFLYLDVPDDGRGIVMALTERGGNDIVTYSTIANTVWENLKPEVNLTILSMSCLGGSIGGGFLLSACHEAQVNMKAMQVDGNRVDPWMYAIVANIKKQIKDQGSIPTYSSLFNGAKKFLKTPFASSHIVDDKYMGPSANELSPTGRNWGQSTSNQDPQLIFFGQSNPLEEKFLCPLVSSPRVGQTGSDWVTRFPRDEYPTSCTL